MDGNQTLLKQDVRGWVRTPAERREALLDEFEGSAVSGAKFAALVGVKYQFVSWVCQRKNKRATPAVSTDTAVALRPRTSLRVVEAVLDPEAKLRDEAPLRMGSMLNEVHLAGGILLEIGHDGQVKLALSWIKAFTLEGSC